MSKSRWKDLESECQYNFPDVLQVNDPDTDLVSIGADLEPATLIYAYAHGLFPMHIHAEELKEKKIGWFSPRNRAIFDLDNIRITRSTKQSAKKYECRIDTCFENMMRMCMTVPRENGWIDEKFIRAYAKLHELGFAHSIEVFDGDELVGGLYGVSFAGFFAGESMVHTKRDASKIALMKLSDVLREKGISLLDAQWMTPHLYSLGAETVTKKHYLQLLYQALKKETMPWP